MSQPSKVGPVFLILFALPFFGGGLMTLFLVLRGLQGPGVAQLIAGFVAMIFVVCGAGLIFAAIRGYESAKERAALEEANPLSPWMWRADWLALKAQGKNRSSEAIAWLICGLWNLICIPAMVLVFPNLLRAADFRAMILLGFAAVGVLLFVWAARASLRHQRFGNSYFEFYALPFIPGDRVSGRIHLKMDAQAEHGVDLRLCCIRRTTTGSGEDSTTNETILWQGDQNVANGGLAPGPMGRAIPVDFAIPADAYVTDHDNPRDKVLWMLHAEADVPGVDYKDDFEVPVFRTSPSTDTARTPDSPASSFLGNFGFTTLSGNESDAGAVPKPSHPKVQVNPQAGGTEFYFPAFRNKGRALVLLIFTIVWTGAVYFLLRSKAPWFFPVVFGFFDLFLLLGVFHTMLGSSRIVVGNGEIAYRRGIFGLGTTRRVSISDVAAIIPVASTQQGGSSGNTMYAIRLRTKNSRKATMADEINSRQEARWIVSRIETLAGLNVDTHVETDSQFGPPPQPGQAFPARPPQKFSFVSLLILMTVVAGIFVYNGWRVSNAIKKRANSLRAARATQPVPRRTFSGKMTQADEQRIAGLPAQDQAEELLERAIEHDALALELFEGKVGGWTSQLRMTPRMTQLEQRSMYSKDLRVRNANADVNLALQGWEKTERAAEILIRRARNDESHRAGAVYYLGMLAGRGVDYDHIHQVLREYAKHDSNANVRQWAVEGMRYLGKDDVLDELFESFTQDPSFSVRDRAGCNISDCGNFTRKQRMRMVPKLIDLAANSRTNAQMKNWCFMALQGITDVNLPGDATTWKNWYAEHGAEKMAEFENLDWWEVRGDE
jgi:hypothetical protein